MKSPLFVVLLFASFLGLDSLPATAELVVKRDIEFARVGDRSLQLDLYFPAPTGTPPGLIVYIHGGAWRAGTRAEMPLGKLIAGGYAVASVDYRLSTEAVFPAQIFDVKAAIRFLRAHQTEYGFDASKIVISGGSAGAHLAELVGVSNGVAELEGNVGTNLGESSAVQATVSYYGASNLQSILSQSTPHGLSVRVPALQLLLGGQPTEKPELARLASPVTHVDRNDPPILLLHGDADPQMPVEQSFELERVCKAAGARVTLAIIPNAKHGGKEFYDDVRTPLVLEFLRSSLSAPAPK